MIGLRVTVVIKFSRISGRIFSQTKAAPIRRPEYAAEDEFHQQTVDRVGKGIPYESVPLQIQTGRNRHTIVSQWNASQNMVRIFWKFPGTYFSSHSIESDRKYIQYSIYS